VREEDAALRVTLKKSLPSEELDRPDGGYTVPGMNILNEDLTRTEPNTNVIVDVLGQGCVSMIRHAPGVSAAAKDHVLTEGGNDKLTSTVGEDEEIARWWTSAMAESEEGDTITSEHMKYQCAASYVSGSNAPVGDGIVVLEGDTSTPNCKRNRRATPSMGSSNAPVGDGIVMLAEREQGTPSPGGRDAPYGDGNVHGEDIAKVGIGEHAGNEVGLAGSEITEERIVRVNETFSLTGEGDDDNITTKKLGAVMRSLDQNLIEGEWQDKIGGSNADGNGASGSHETMPKNGLLRVSALAVSSFDAQEVNFSVDVDVTPELTICKIRDIVARETGIYRNRIKIGVVVFSHSGYETIQADSGDCTLAGIIGDKYRDGEFAIVFTTAKSDVGTNGVAKHSVASRSSRDPWQAGRDR